MELKTVLDILIEFLVDSQHQNDKSFAKILKKRYWNKKTRKLLTIEVLSKMNLNPNLRIPKVKNYFNTIEELPENTFYSHFRMSRTAFMKLVQRLQPFWQNRGGHPMTNLKHCLYITLWALGNQNSFRELADRYDKSQSTVHFIVLKTSRILRKIAKQYIKWPQTCFQFEQMVNNFNELRSRGFPNVVGCIDGMHISIHAPKSDSSSYYNRKGYYSMILQAVCKSDGSFLNIFFGWPGRSHDAYVFRNSELGKRLEEGTIKLPEDIHIVGDSAYPLSSYLMVPYKDNGNLTSSQKIYNKELSSTRVIIEQSFGKLKSKFRILQMVNLNKLSIVKGIILACCVLHNFIIAEDNELILVNNDERLNIDNSDNEENCSENREDINALTYIKEMLFVILQIQDTK